MEYNLRTLNVERSTSTAHRLTEYDGVCGDLHGHNMRWEVGLTVNMWYSDSDNMPLDLKDVSGFLDEYFDHGVVLRRDDRLLQELDVDFTSDTEFPFLTRIEPIGKVLVIDSGDPTCEVLVDFAANYLTDLEAVERATVEVFETDKYGISTSVYKPDSIVVEDT